MSFCIIIIITKHKKWRCGSTYSADELLGFFTTFHFIILESHRIQHFSTNPKTQQRGITTLTPCRQARNKKCRLEGPRQNNPPIVDTEKDRLLAGRPAALMELIKYTDAHLEDEVKSADCGTIRLLNFYF